MPKYIALLRGINVSGVKIIKMEDLRIIFADMGYKNVQTYIQSGNVVFETTKKTLSALTNAITKGLAAALGYDVPVVVVESQMMQRITDEDVFTNKMKTPVGTKKYIAFLERELTEQDIQIISSLSNSADTYHIDGSLIYITIDETKGKSMFTNMLIEKKLKLYATTRNWNTVCKLASM